MRLRIANENGQPATRHSLTLRWTLKFLPLTALLAFSLTAYVVLTKLLPWAEATTSEAEYYQRSDRFWNIVRVLEMIPYPLVGALIAALVIFLLFRRRGLHDHLAKTSLVQLLRHRPWLPAVRGFEPIIGSERDASVHARSAD